MRILIFTQYFTPEITAPAVRLHAIAAGLAERGHEVEVICEIPNHPRGIVDSGYRGRLVQRRSLHGFRAHYVWVRASPSKTSWARIASYGSYALMAAMVGSVRRRPDVIFASSPPLPVGAAGLAAATRHRVPWVFDVRDLWPEFAVALGELTGERVIRAAERLERALYARASLITTPTETFRDHILARSPNSTDVVVIPNGTTAEWLAAGNAEPQRAALGLPEDRFVWGYVGNIGIAQDVGNAVRAAALLDDGYQLLIVGDGPERAAVERWAEELPAGRVRFTGLVEAEMAARYMRSADALLIPLVRDSVLGGAVPSKLYDSCAVGRPVIVAAPGESRRIAERFEVGLPVDPGDPEALAAAVRRLRDDEALRERLSARGRAFAAEHLRDHQVDRLDSLLANQSGRW